MASRILLRWYRPGNLAYDPLTSPEPVPLDNQAATMLERGTTTLRPAHRSESARIARMSRSLVEHGLRWRWTPRRVRQAIRDKETLVVVATVGGDLVGFAIMKFGDDNAHLHLLAVDPRHRRRGIATALLEWLEAACRTAGMQGIRVEVRLRNRPARQFYAQLGYDRLGQINGYYDRIESAAVLVKPLVRPDVPPISD